MDLRDEIFNTIIRTLVALDPKLVLIFQTQF